MEISTNTQHNCKTQNVTELRNLYGGKTGQLGSNHRAAAAAVAAADDDDDDNNYDSDYDYDMTVQWIRRLVAGWSLRKSELDPRLF